jgi:hypothetical protein
MILVNLSGLAPLGRSPLKCKFSVGEIHLRTLRPGISVGATSTSFPARSVAEVAKRLHSCIAGVLIGAVVPT